jgi:hypothetical protein
MIGYLVGFIKWVVIIAVILVIWSIEGNKLKLGTCYSSASEDERVKRRFFDVFEIFIRRLNALCCIKQYYKKEKKGRIVFGKVKLRWISFLKADKISREFIRDMIDLVNSKYPDNGFFSSDRKVVLVSSSFIRKDAVKDYNGRAMTNGTTQITYAYFELWNSGNDIPKDIKEDLMANVLLHEAGHHVFRLFTGVHISNSKLRFISYINECFADLACYKMMGKTGREAADIMRYKYDKLLGATDNDKCTSSHPSNNYRIKFLEKGVFGEKTIRDIADYINENEGPGYISDALVREISEIISAFRKEHPELDFFFGLKREDVA